MSIEEINIFMKLFNDEIFRNFTLDTEFKCIFDLSNHDPDLSFKTERQW